MKEHHPMKMTTKPKNVITARAKAFSGEGIREYQFAVSEQGTVRVWDAIAGHYTTCHSLSESAQARIRKLAAEAKGE